MKPLYITQADIKKYKTGQASLTTQINKLSLEPIEAEKFSALQERIDHVQEQLAASGVDWDASARINSLLDDHKEETKGIDPKQLKQFEKQLWKDFNKSNASL